MLKQTMFRVIAFIFSLILNICVIWLAVFSHITWAKAHRENAIPLIRQSGIAQHLFLEKNYLKLIGIISKDEFTTVWDATSGVSLSKEIFTPTTMYGEQKYRYKANVSIYNAVVWSGLFYQPLVFQATPETEALLSKMTVVHQIRFDTDSNGFKKTTKPYTRDSILFLGDSFTEGLWVESGDTFVSLVGEASPVINAGVNGYSTLEMAWTLEHYGPLLKPKSVVVNLFPNDVKADYLQVIQGDASDEEYSIMFKYLDKILESCTENGFDLIVSMIPAKEQLTNLRGNNDFANKIKKWGTEKGVIILDPLPYFDQYGGDSLYFTWDPHLSIDGHKRYAEFLSDQIRSSIK